MSSRLRMPPTTRLDIGQETKAALRLDHDHVDGAIGKEPHVLGRRRAAVARADHHHPCRRRHAGRRGTTAERGERAAREQPLHHLASLHGALLAATPAK